VAIAPKFVDSVPVTRLFLALNNPRHEPVETEVKAIARLCDKELVFPLARDIVSHGLNPLERFALHPTHKGKQDGVPVYHVLEGNRRICAIKLLNDPDLAPAPLRKSFEKLAKDWTAIKSVHGVVFEREEDARIWLSRVHNGMQGGVGRKSWDSVQKTRFDGGNKNRAALAILDYAVKERTIKPDDRSGKLTTAQRFLSNAIFREALGIDQSDPETIQRNRPKLEFDIVAKRFVKDLIEGESVHSRMNRPDIENYARSLNALPGVTATRIQSEPLDGPSERAPSASKKSTPKRPTKIHYVAHDAEIAAALKSLGNEKLKSLYYSVCAIELDPHAPIVSVGAWAFFETLTACAGRNERTSFDAFLNKQKLQSYGIEDAAVHQSIVRIREYGNTTKHHSVSATFNGEQLNNDFTTLREVVLKCASEAASKK